MSRLSSESSTIRTRGRSALPFRATSNARPSTIDSGSVALFARGNAHVTDRVEPIGGRLAVDARVGLHLHEPYQFGQAPFVIDCVGREAFRGFEHAAEILSVE